MASTIDRIRRRLLHAGKRQAKAPVREDASVTSPQAEAVIAAFPAEGAPIRPITHPEFDGLIETYPYYAKRWKYTSVALAEAATLISARGLGSALELGVHVRPVIVGADAMDIVARPELQPGVALTIHDATVAPWPYADKQYDLFVALQVFEHLRDRQPEAFLEVRRIARHAIISLPIDWVMSNPRNCHHQLSNERALSWFAPVVPTRVVEGSVGRFKRLVYVFEDLPAPD